MATLIILSHKFLFNSDRSLNDVQVAHLVPTPRNGGLAVLVAITVSAIIFKLGNVTWVIISSLPIFIIGVAEDYYVKTTPTLRYILGACSASCGIFLSGVVLNSVDIGYLDKFLSAPFIAFIFTVFCIVGLINAINLIDGIHGLALGVCIVISLSFFLVARKVGDVELASLGILLAAASFGLMILNYPFGKIFLGDSGAYLMGLLLAWLMILLAMRYENVSKWSLLAIASWPVMETIFSIVRRKLTRRPADRPDRMHFHHVVMRGLEIMSKSRISRQMSNPLATLIIVPLACIPAILGTFYSQSHQAGVAIFCMFSCLYIFSYYGLVYLFKREKSSFSYIKGNISGKINSQINLTYKLLALLKQSKLSIDIKKLYGKTI